MLNSIYHVLLKCSRKFEYVLNYLNVHMHQFVFPSNIESIFQ